MTDIILASGSKSRLALLRRSGLRPHVMLSGVDESSIQEHSPEVLVRVLAQAKARAVASRVPHGLVIGCDSLLVVNGKVFGKPQDAEQAAAWWQERSGKSGFLLTGHCVMDAATGRESSRTCSTLIDFSAVSEEDVRSYVATTEALSAAGAFTLDGMAGWFISGIQGDPGNVTGISLPTVRSLMSELGIDVGSFLVESEERE